MQSNLKSPAPPVSIVRDPVVVSEDEEDGSDSPVVLKRPVSSLKPPPLPQPPAKISSPDQDETKDEFEIKFRPDFIAKPSVVVVVTAAATNPSPKSSSADAPKAPEPVKPAELIGGSQHSSQEDASSSGSHGPISQEPIPEFPQDMAAQFSILPKHAVALSPAQPLRRSKPNREQRKSRLQL